jgi:hypothetical protein
MRSGCHVDHGNVVGLGIGRCGPTWFASDPVRAVSTGTRARPAPALSGKNASGAKSGGLSAADCRYFFFAAGLALLAFLAAGAFSAAAAFGFLVAGFAAALGLAAMFISVLAEEYLARKVVG